MARATKKKTEVSRLANLVPKPVENKYINPEKTTRGKIVPKKKIKR